MMEVLEKAIVPVLIAAIGGSAWFKTYLDYKKEVKAKKELSTENVALKQEVQDLSLPIQIDLQVFNNIKDIVEGMFTHTKADRFLILSATNGIKEMRFATAIYEHHKHKGKVALSIGATSKYVKFEFDSPYKNMLKAAEINGTVILDVNAMEDCDLKQIYNSEEVNHSIVAFILRAKIDDQNDRLFYCSLATHEDKGFSKNEMTHVRIGVSRLRSIFKEYNS